MFVDIYLLLHIIIWFDYHSLYITRFLWKLAVLTPCALALCFCAMGLMDYWVIAIASVFVWSMFMLWDLSGMKVCVNIYHTKWKHITLGNYFPLEKLGCHITRSPTQHRGTYVHSLWLSFSANTANNLCFSIVCLCVVQYLDGKKFCHCFHTCWKHFLASTCICWQVWRPVLILVVGFHYCNMVAFSFCLIFQLAE